MPDNSYQNIKDATKTGKMNAYEPREYEEEYFYSKKGKIISILPGLAWIGVAIWLGLTGSKSILIPVISGLMGLFISYFGMKELLDKTAKLNLA